MIVYRTINMSNHETGRGAPEAGRNISFSGAETTPTRPPIRSLERSGETIGRTEGSPRLKKVRSFLRVRAVDSGDENKAMRETFLREQAILAALTGAAHRGETVTYGWARPEPAGKRGKTTILTSLLPRKVDTGGPVDDTKKEDTTEKTTRRKEFAAAPPGTVVEDIDPQVLQENRAKMKHWGRVEVQFHGVVPSVQSELLGLAEKVGTNPGLALDSALITYNGAYEFSVVAEPFTEEEILEKKEIASGKHNRAKARDYNSIEEAGTAEEQKQLVEELRRDVHQGRFKRPSIVVGAQTEEELNELVHTVADASITQLPYTISINPRRYNSYENAVANIPEPGPDGQVVPEPEYDENNVGVSAEMLRRFLSIPQGELYGVGETAREPYAVNTTFEDEFEKHPEKFLVIGTIEDRYGVDAGPIIIPKSHLDKHLGVWAASGAGKTRLLQILTVEAVTGEEARPVLFVDPKGKQEGQPSNAKILADMLDPHGVKVVEINPANLLLEGGGDNPMDPQGAPLASYVNDLITVVSNAFGSQPGQDDNISSEVTTRFLTDAIKGKRSGFKGIYERFGWNIQTGKPLVPGSNPVYPTLWDLIDVAKEAVQDQEYQGEARNIEPFLEQRLQQLNTGYSGVFFSGEQMDWNKIFAPQDNAQVTVFDISELDAKDQALVMGMVLLRKQRFLKHNAGAKCLTVLDEINTLVESNPNTPPGPLTKRIGTLFAQLREFKGGLVVAGQSPDVVPTQMLQNIGTHIPMRTKGEAGANAMKVPVRLTDAQIEELTTYPDRSAVMLTDGMPFPVRGYVRDTNSMPQGEADVLLPGSKFIVDASEGRRFIDEEKVELRRVLDGTLEGGKLLALTDTITATTLLGLDPVRINYDKLREEGKNYFEHLRDRDPAERNFLVRQAAERTIRARTQKVLRPDIPVEDYISHIEAKVHNALDDEVQHPPLTGSKYTLPDYWMFPVKAELTGFLALADEQGIDQKKIGRHPESDGKLKAMLQGGELYGDTVDEQLSYVHYAIPTTQMIFLAKNPRSGKFILDRGIGQTSTGSNLTEAIDKNETENTWLNEYADFLRELILTQNTSSTIYNEVIAHVEQQVARRDRRRDRERPGGGAHTEQIDMERITAAVAGGVTAALKTQEEQVIVENPRQADQPLSRGWGEDGYL